MVGKTPVFRSVYKQRVCQIFSVMSVDSDTSDDSEIGVEEPDRVSSVEESACRQLSRAPPASARLAAARIQQGNPDYGPRMQLYCRTGFFLAIFSDKTVRGSKEYLHPNSFLELHSVNFGEIKIRGIDTNLFLAMNSKGRLYAEANPSAPSTVFVEYMFGLYNVYLSKHWAHLGWYVGLKKSGKTKPGKQTRWGQKAIQFLPKRLNS